MKSRAEAFDTPMYASAMAARLVGLDPGRVRRWLRGYEYVYAPKTSAPRRRTQSPLVARDGAAESSYASFLDLFRGERGDVDRVAACLDLSPGDVRAAVQFEERLAAA